jgi:protein-S-isoprenylcysteine O-methyltransferase Ste14
MTAIDIIIGAGWVVFWVYWLVMAGTAKAGRSRWTPFAGVRVGIILVILLLIRLRIFKGHGTATGNPWLLGIGLAIFVLGLALAVWARIYLGRNWGMPMSQKADPELVTTGPYQRIRHPIYSGIILGMAGTAIAVSLYWLIAAAILGAYFLFSAVVEEHTMAKLFPLPTRPTSARRRCSSRTSSDQAARHPLTAGSEPGMGGAMTAPGAGALTAGVTEVAGPGAFGSAGHAAAPGFLRGCRRGGGVGRGRSPPRWRRPRRRPPIRVPSTSASA